MRHRPWLQWVVIAAMGIVLSGTLVACGDDITDEPSAPAAAPEGSAADREETGEAATPTPEPTPAPKELVAQALTAVRVDNYAKATGKVQGLARMYVLRVRKAISDRLGKRALTQVKRGANGGARRLLAQARRYPTTEAVRTAQGALDDALALIAERRADARAARIAARKARRAAAPAPPAAPSIPSGPCYSIPQTDFPVPPGDERDADGDGIACES